MSTTNYDNVKDQLLSGGLRVSHLQVGKMMRVPSEGDTGKQKTGWYILHELSTGSGDLLLVGSFGNWRDGGKHTVSLKGHTISAEEKAVLRKKVAEDRKRADAKRKADHKKAAVKAEQAWQKCEPCGVHDLPQYLIDKGVQAHGLKISPKGALMISLHDVDGQISGLQVIHDDPETIKKKGRNKDFWPTGLEKKGRFFQIGTPTWIVLIAEGYATGASLNEATGFPVVVTFDAGNLTPVAEAIHKRYRDVKILICGDDDFLTRDSKGVLNNPGVAQASMAALACNGKWVVPVFHNRGDKKLTDFNDLHQAEGLTPVRTQIESAVLDAGWSATAVDAVGAQQGGRGEHLKPNLTINEANARFAQIFGAKGVFFDNQERNLVPKQDVLDLLPEHGWREWRPRPDRSVVRVGEVGFDPTGLDPKIRCNLWGGWPTAPKAGDCSKLLQLLQHLCSNELNCGGLYEWVLKWLAYPIQNVGAKMQTALVFQGGQGVGKSLFFESYMELFDEYGCLVNQSAIEDKYNSWKSKKLFVVANEVVASGDLYHNKNIIKGMITDPYLRINPKNVTDYWEANHANVVFLSNEVKPLVLEKNDRRFCVVRTPKKLESEVYVAIGEELRCGGIAALHEHLLNLDLEDFYPHTKPPMTQAKEELIILGMDSSEHFIEDWVNGEIGLPLCVAKSDTLYPFYLKYCRRKGVFRPRPEKDFLGMFNNLDGWNKTQQRMYSNLHFNGPVKRKMVIIPPEEVMVDGDKMQINEQLKHWITRNVLKVDLTVSNFDQGDRGAGNEY